MKEMKRSEYWFDKDLNKNQNETLDECHRPIHDFVIIGIQIVFRQSYKLKIKQ